MRFSLKISTYFSPLHLSIMLYTGRGLSYQNRHHTCNIATRSASWNLSVSLEIRRNSSNETNVTLQQSFEPLRQSVKCQKPLSSTPFMSSLKSSIFKAECPSVIPSPMIGVEIHAYTVMPLGLKNAPRTFQKLMNTIFRNLDEFVICYLDDVLIFSKTFADHLIHVETVLQILKQENLSANPKKCTFHTDEVDYFGKTISPSGRSLKAAKVEAFDRIEMPSTIKEIRMFLGATGFFRDFIQDYAKIAQPLTELLKKDTKFEMTTERQRSVCQMKNEMKTAPVLAFPNWNEEFILTTVTMLKYRKEICVKSQYFGRTEI